MTEGGAVPHLEIKCPECAKVVVISKTAHRDAYVCHFCGAKLPPVEGATPRRLRFKDEQEMTQAAQAAPDGKAPAKTEMTAQEKVVQAATKRVASRAARKKFVLAGALPSFIMFLVLGGAAGFCRYGNVLSEEQMALIPKYGPIVVLALHIFIVIKAFSDSVFQGVLCLLVPLYSLYYLFGVADDFPLRAITAAVLIGVGQDSAVVFQEKFMEAASAVNAWISSGGGD
jgi:predicted RND superfamily exporter protein